MKDEGAALSVPRKPLPSRPTGKKPARQPNRAQVRAMQVRTAVTPDVEAPIAPAAVEVIPTVDEPSSPRSARSRRTEPSSAAVSERRAGRARTRAAARPVALSRAEEYGFIRSDLRRLLLTASLLGAIMIALLFVLEM